LIGALYCVIDLSYFVLLVRRLMVSVSAYVVQVWWWLYYDWFFQWIFCCHLDTHERDWTSTLVATYFHVLRCFALCHWHVQLMSLVFMLF